jgi:predicted XRE-type DNA-binding protein
MSTVKVEGSRAVRLRQKSFSAAAPVTTINDFCAFNEETFHANLIIDIGNCVEEIKLQSPWITEWRSKPLLPVLERAVKRGVTLCCFLREPDLWRQFGNPDLAEETKKEHADADALFTSLKNIGAHVNLRPSIHEKLNIIDNRIVWDGSLNTLSHRNTFERMTRMVSRHFAHETIVKHRLDTCAECWSNRCRLQFAKPQAEMHLRLLAQQLLEARQDCMSQHALAELLGVDQAAISRFESGSRGIKNELLLQIAGIVGFELVPVPSVLVPAVAMFIQAELSTRGQVTKPKRKRN